MDGDTYFAISLAVDIHISQIVNYVIYFPIDAHCTEAALASARATLKSISSCCARLLPIA